MIRTNLEDFENTYPIAIKDDTTAASRVSRPRRTTPPLMIADPDFWAVPLKQMNKRHFI